MLKVQENYVKERKGIKALKAMAKAYDRATKGIKEPALKELLTRIRDHELYPALIFLVAC
jgi:hypothetical protein